MLTLREVVDRFHEGKTYRRMHEDGSFEQLTPIFPVLMGEVRYTVANREGEFIEWSTLVIEMLLAPSSGIGPDNWIEI